MSLLLIALLSLCFLSVQCQQSIQSIRLAGNGSTANRGRVEIQSNNIWGTVCKDNFDENAATVACRMLGFNHGGTNISHTIFGPGSGPIWLDGFRCLGTELKLEDCQLSTTSWNNSDCNHTEDAAVECIVLQNTVGNVRLVPSNLGYGYVEAFVNGVWGAICNTGWNIYNARVICRQLRFNASLASAGAPASVGTAWSNTTRSFVLDGLDCTGGEPSILNCTYQTSPSCDASNRHRYASVTCVTFPSTSSTTIVPSLTCTNGQFQANFSRQNHPTIQEQHFILAKNVTCILNKHTAVNAIIISFDFHDCGTVHTTNTTHIMYINELIYEESNPGNPALVTAYSIRLRCEFKRSQNSSVGVIQPITEQVTQVAPGQYTTRLDFYTDGTLSTPILSYPLQIVVGEYVYVAAILDTAETNLKLVIQNCRATPNPDPSSPSSHHLILNKCPSDPALALSFLPVNRTMHGFVYKSFKFHNSDDVYLHCDLTVCLASETTGQCDRYCAPSAGRKRKRDAPLYASFHVRSPPIHFVSDIYRGGEKTSVGSKISVNLYLLMFVIILKNVFQ